MTVTSQADYNFGNVIVAGHTFAQYTSTLNVWLQPGAVDYVYSGTGASSVITKTVVSNYTNPGMTTNITLTPGGSNVLVVPGYMLDGTFADALDLPYPDDSFIGNDLYDCYRADSYLMPYMWPDDGSTGVSTIANAASSQYRQLMYRNYANLLTGYYIYRADDPLLSPSREPADLNRWSWITPSIPMDIPVRSMPWGLITRAPVFTGPSI